MNTLESTDNWSYTFSTQTLLDVYKKKTIIDDLTKARISNASASAVQDMNDADIK